MPVKYQVFISSTYDDLKCEREQVLKATLEMGHIPVGMEMFSAADEEQWRIITRQIDECDYYAVIVAHRYGSTVDGVSYTEKEYNYAVSQGIPVLGFVIESDASWPTDRVDTNSEQKSALDTFREKVKAKPVSFWSSAADLHGKFSISLMKQINSSPRPGWTRATESIGADVVNELSRLSRENAELRSQLEAALHKAEDDAASERRQIMQTMRKIKVKCSFYYEAGKNWEHETEFTMSQIFTLLAPEMMIEKSTENIAMYIGLMLNPHQNRDVRPNYPIPSNSLKRWISDFITLGLFEPSTKRHSVSDTSEYWSLTEFGRDVYTQLRLKQLATGDLDENDAPAETG